MDVVEIAVAAGPDVVGDGEGLEAFANELNGLFASRGVQFTVDLLDGNGGSSPADIGEGVRYFYVLFGREADPAVEAAFDAALARGRQAGAAGVYTYFRTLDGSAPGQDVAGEVQAFMERLDGELQHYWSTYGHVDALKLKVLLEIERDTGGAKVEVKEGKTLLDGAEVTGIDMGNVPMYANNKALAQLKVDYEVANTAFLEAVSSGDAERILATSSKRQELWDSLRELERDILGLAKTLSKEEATGGSVRLREASRLAEAGDIDGALQVLDDPQRQAELERAQELGEASIRGMNRWLGEQKAKAELYLQKGHTNEAIEAAVQAYEQAMAELRKSPTADLAILDGYSELLFQINRPSKMLKILEFKCKLLEFREEVDYVEYAHTLGAMAQACELIQEYDRGKKLAEHAVEIFRKNLKDTSESTKGLAWALNILAGILYNLGDYEESEKKYRKALELRKSLPASQENTSLVGFSLNNLARALAELDRIEEAEESYRESIKFRGGDEDANEFSLAEGYTNLASLLADTHRLKEAEECYCKALKMLRKLAQDEPAIYLPEVARTLNDLAGTLNDLGENNEEVNNALEEALSIRRNLVKIEQDAYSLDLARTLVDLACFRHDCGDVKEAENLYREALEIRKPFDVNATPAHLRETGRIYNNMASALESQGRLSEAEKAWRKALDILECTENQRGEKYREARAVTLANYADAMKHTPEEAEKLYREALELYRQLAEDQPEIFSSSHAVILGELAKLAWNRGEHQEAFAIWKEATNEHRLYLSPENTQLMSVMLWDFGATLANVGRRDEAKIALAEFLELCTKLPDSEREEFRKNEIAARSYLGDT